MKRKRKRLKKRVKFFIFIFIIFLTIFLYNNKKENIDKEEQISHSNISNESISYSTTTQTKEPLEKLEELSQKDKRIKTIIENKGSYPEILLMMLSKNTDMTDYVYHYNKYKGKVFSDNLGKVKKGQYPLLLQYDKRWGYGNYGDSVIAMSGCGPTSVAMVIAGLTGRNDITPYDIAKYAYENGYYENGTSWDFFTKGVIKYGIIGKEIALSESVMVKELKEGHPIICSMRPGDFTTTGHLILITDYKNDKFKINDPNSKERSNKLWSYQTLKTQIKNLWSFTEY